MRKTTNYPEVNMNDHDKNNLNFLLTASDQELKVWYDKTTELEHEYANELLRRYYVEVAETAQELLEEWTLDSMTEHNSFPDAELVLLKFKA